MNKPYRITFYESGYVNQSHSFCSMKRVNELTDLFVSGFQAATRELEAKAMAETEAEKVIRIKKAVAIKQGRIV